MRLTMYLLREGADGGKEDLRQRANVRELRVRVRADRLTAYIVEGDSKAPSWMKELNRIADLDVEHRETLSRSYGAVVFVKTGGRVLAVCFGTGFHAVEPAQIERGFGLRTTANLVAAERVRGAQTRGVASNSRDQKTFLPTDGTFSDLAVEVDEDWLRELSGKSGVPSIATTLAGADSLRITVPEFSLNALPEKADEVFSAYQSDDYKERFAFLGQIAPLDRSDPRIDQLDQLVVEQLSAHEAGISFAMPDPFTQGDLDHYEFALGYQGRYRLEDVLPSAVFKILEQLDKAKNPLVDVKVSALNEDDELVDRVHPLKSYVQTEVQFQGEDFLLSAGLWFAVRKDFSSTVQSQVDRIADLTDELSLPVWDAKVLADDSRDKTAEGSYNIATAETEGYALLDKKLVIFSAYERLEISDLLTPAGQLLCVKSASSSATLSHLVAQAINSAGAWGDVRYQDKLGEAWVSLHGDATSSLGREEAVFVLAIATPKPGPLRESLFFFAKVQVANCARLLERAGFRVALARIEMINFEPVKVPRKSKVVFK
ncbi:DUF6119 family protein [Pseudoclavibacter sp. AY1H1]|uniref:DUF6119 family protein n=1 Tax=Pseudoclavibacter sp. AY1H1 TaxID=2080584 RepID=UPI000CE8A3A1|nr:DUF6119 family protein [Pseudoclavibacter sp. AY1H1]PPF39658.1 hypothetical protein C5E05_00060 [Pseudoclavibacter sp. AY1H1]